MATLQYILKLLAQAPLEYRNFYLTIRGLEELIAAVLDRPDGLTEAKVATIDALIELYEPQLLGFKSEGAFELPVEFGVDLTCPQCADKSCASGTVPETSLIAPSPPPSKLIDQLDAQLDLKFGKWVLTSSDDDYGGEDPSQP